MSTKAEILNRSKDLFLRYGIRSVTMDDLAKELGMSKKTLYQYFDNKADLIRHILFQILQEEKATQQQIKSAAKDAIQEMIGIVKHVTQMLRMVPSNTLYDMEKYYRESWELMKAHNKDHVCLVILENLHRGIDEGLYRMDFNPNFIARLFVGKIPLIADEEHFPAKEYNREQLFAEFINYHLHGIASEKGLKLMQQYLHQENPTG